MEKVYKSALRMFIYLRISELFQGMHKNFYSVSVRVPWSQGQDMQGYGRGWVPVDL